MSKDPQLETFIKQAREQMHEKGLEASPQAVFLVGIGHLASQHEEIKDRLPERRKRDVAIKLGTPAAVGGGLVGAVIAFLNYLAS